MKMLRIHNSAFPSRPTAFLAMNDVLAKEYYLWFRALGLRIPRDLSIISFDNMYESKAYGIASVDFGYADMGYRAAHLLIGDIPVATDGRRWHIRPEPVLHDRGSIGPPRKGVLQL